MLHGFCYREGCEPGPATPARRREPSSSTAAEAEATARLPHTPAPNPFNPQSRLHNIYLRLSIPQLPLYSVRRNAFSHEAALLFPYKNAWLFSSVHGPGACKGKSRSSKFQSKPVRQNWNAQGLGLRPRGGNRRLKRTDWSACGPSLKYSGPAYCDRGASTLLYGC